MTTHQAMFRRCLTTRAPAATLLLSMIHEARNDLAMLFGSLFLLIVGAGRRSLDHRLTYGEKLLDPFA